MTVVRMGQDKIVLSRRGNLYLRKVRATKFCPCGCGLFTTYNEKQKYNHKCCERLVKSRQ